MSMTGGVSEHLTKPFLKARPKWLLNKSGNRLELDGYNEELKLAFEFQGAQHYKFISMFHKNRTLEETKRTDLLKRDLCEQHGIRIVIIPHTFKMRHLQGYIIARCKKLLISIPEINDHIDYNTFDIYSPSSKKLKEKEIQAIASSRGGICL